MSKHNRTSRRRRIAVGLGATGGGLLAAAFMPMGIALAAPVVTPDPGLFPADTETTPDPFSDFTGFPDVSNGATLAEGNLDNQLNIDNPALAAQIDYDIDNKEPFSFNTLDHIPATPTDYTGGGPFEDAYANNMDTASSGITLADAQSYDYALSQGLQPGEVTQLDALANGSTTVIPEPPVVDNDPAADFVSLFDHNAFDNPINPSAPTDALGEFATFEDQFLNAFGLGGPLDQFEDLFTGGLTNTTVDALGGLGSTSTDAVTGLTGTGADAFTNVFADLAGLF